MAIDTSTDTTLTFRNLGRIDYDTAWAVQQQVHADVLAGRAAPTVLMLEHEPVITVTRRSEAQHLLADKRRLAELGVAVCPTNRGGAMTYHGPGQLVAYPIIPLQRFGLNVRRYVHLLEQVIVDTLGRFAIAAHREPGAIGVWVDPQARSPLAQPAKIAAIGVRVRRWVTLHGLALNVAPDLEHFKLIVPCGLDRPVTTMAAVAGEQSFDMQRVRAEMRRQFVRYFHLP